MTRTYGWGMIIMAEGMLGTDQMAQVALIVRDIEATSRKYAEFLGVDKPPVLVTGMYEQAQTMYRGKPSKARAKLAFFQVGPGLQLELIEPDQEPSVWREFLDQHGEGVHHIAFIIKGMGGKILRLEQAGMELVQTGEYEGGRYAYVDANKDLKVLLELLEND